MKHKIQFVIGEILISIGGFGVFQSLFVLSDSIVIPVKFLGITFIDHCALTAWFMLISMLFLIIGIRLTITIQGHDKPHGKK